MNAINLAKMTTNEMLAAGYSAIDAACEELRSLSHDEVKAIAVEIGGVFMSLARKSRKQAIEAIRDRLYDRLAKMERGEVIAAAYRLEVIENAARV